MGSWASYLGGLIFCWSRGNCIFFFQFGIVCTWPMYHSFNQRVWFMVIFSSQRELHSVPNMNFLCYIVTYFVPVPVITGRIMKMYSSHFNGELWSGHLSWFINSIFICTPQKCWLFEKSIFELEAFWDNSKINSILVRQLKSFQKMVVSSAKFTISILWSPICIPLILVSASIKIASTSATIMHNNTESGQPCWNLWMRVKDSDRRPFILILDWIMMEATWIMWMNLFL